MGNVSEFDQSDQHKLAEAHLRAVTFNSTRFKGIAFFRKLVQDLANTLQFKYVLIGELVNLHGTETIRTLAIWHTDDWASNFSYPLENTPCQQVVLQIPCFHASKIQYKFPLDNILKELKAESYLGTPLMDTSGRCLGVLIAVDDQPLDEVKQYLTLSLLTVFSTRCAAELQHRNREAELERRVSVRTVELKNANSDLRKNEEKLKYLAYHDNLTGLANRTLFNEHLERALKLSQRSKIPVTMMMIDLDEFKPVNDVYGHAAGDIVLTTVAQRLLNLLRAGDLVARFGGDEFAILLGGNNSKQISKNIARSIINVVSSPIAIKLNTQLEVGCTIGIASNNNKNMPVASLIKLADTAMYQAKRDGKKTWCQLENHDDKHLVKSMDVPNYQHKKRPEINEVATAYGQFSETDMYKNISTNLLDLNSQTASTLGVSFFQTLVKNLAQILDLHYVIAGKLITINDVETIQTVAIWGGSQWLSNMSYASEGTPCQNVTCQSQCFHASNVQELYPRDTLLVDLDIVSYIGLPMIDTEGQTVGTLVGMDKKPIDSSKQYIASSLMTMFATRGAAELQHTNRQIQIESALQTKTMELTAAREEILKLSHTTT